MQLSPRQEGILAFIREFIQENGYPPTIREIGRAVGISSTSVVNYNLNVLQNKGFLSREQDVARGLRLIEKGIQQRDTEATEMRAIPILGVIAAGEPLLIPDDSFSSFSSSDYETISLTRDIVPDDPRVYALRVKGDSMIDALVNDGDIVVLRQEDSEPKRGDMIAAWLRDEQETTLKRYYPEKEHNRIRLQPANPLMEPIYVKPENLEIKGRVILVIRKLY